MQSCSTFQFIAYLMKCNDYPEGKIMTDGGKLADLSNFAGLIIGFVPLFILIYVFHVKRPTGLSGL